MLELSSEKAGLKNKIFTVIKMHRFREKVASARSVLVKF